MLAIPCGWVIGSFVFGNYFGDAIFVAPAHDVASGTAAECVLPMILHGLTALPFCLAVAGVATAYVLYLLKPDLHGKIRVSLRPLVRVLEERYPGFDRFNWFFAAARAPSDAACGVAAT